MNADRRASLRAQHVPTYVDTWAAIVNYKRGLSGADVCACGVVYPCSTVELLDALDAAEAFISALGGAS